MAYTVDFKTVSTTGLESSPVAQSLAGLRANEARYIWNKFKVPYVTYPIAEKSDSFAWLQTILAERALTFAAKPLEICDLALPRMRWVEVYYQDGLVVNVMYSLTDPKNGQSASNSVKAWLFPMNSSVSSSLPAKNQSLPARFGVPFS